jgi:hypothetical protein
MWGTRCCAVGGSTLVGGRLGHGVAVLTACMGIPAFSGLLLWGLTLRMELVTHVWWVPIQCTVGGSGGDF